MAEWPAEWPVSCPSWLERTIIPRVMRKKPDRDQIHRLREDKKSLYNKITELQKQLTVQATAEPAHRPAEEEIDLSTTQNSVYSNREKMLRQSFLISWGGCIATTAIMLYSLKPYI
ncbi:hypothetical protein DY000_02008485 [Brassica cretica]|uniref:Uncharacterized protein n=1 Tax=Brassica cretica TaxID=69181 RepID=A0ABQ7C127_BRACR|nr:hypothetical protein DY000_02008485 [Brassica cretica]